MNIYWFTATFIAWYFLALIISEQLGKKRKIGVEWSFFISVMLSPVIGLAITLLSKSIDLTTGNQRNHSPVNEEA